MLASFADGMRVVVAGASGGIGRMLIDHLAACPKVDGILALSRSPAGIDHDKVEQALIDFDDEKTIAAASALAARHASGIDLVLVATGLLHEADGIRPEKTWRSLTPHALARVFQVNAIGPALMAKHFLPMLAPDRKAVFCALSARVGSIGDNRLGGWHAYRASKAALNMLIKTFSIELARRHPGAVCIGLHPGTVETGLSAPFRSGIRPEKLFTPSCAAIHLLEVIDQINPADSGRQFAWDGQVIPD